MIGREGRDSFLLRPQPSFSSLACDGKLEVGLQAVSVPDPKPTLAWIVFSIAHVL